MTSLSLCTLLPAVTLADVLARHDVWRGDALAGVPAPTCPSGFVQLDNELPGGGWPRAQLIEILHPCHGMGELSLLLPALVRLAAEGLRIAMVLPPRLAWRVHAPAWAAAGVPPERVLLVRPGNARDALWAAVQSMRCPAVGATLFWPDAFAAQAPRRRSSAHGVAEPDKGLRRLQAAVGEGGGCAILLRPSAVAGQASPAPLRLGLGVVAGRLQITLLKRRGSPARAPLWLDLPRPVSLERLAHALARTQSATVCAHDAALA